VIRAAWRRLVRFFGSAVLATWLLAIVGIWSVLGSLVPQGASSATTVRAWAVANPVLEPVVSAIGLHQAFASPLFTVCILVLGLSTALCAWQRTKVAIGKARTLRKSALADGTSVAASHDLEIACDPALGGAEALSVAAETLARIGIKTTRRDDLLAAVSPSWTVWGSPVFHWALLALILTLIGGNLFRSQGLMGVAVGQTKADVPDSYGTFSAGALHDLGRVDRGIRVDSLEPHFVSGGIDRGPTPTVSVLDASGKVIKTQRVYPNMTLKAGSLTIYPDNYGLSVALSTVTSSGVGSGRGFLFADFSVEPTTATVPLEPLSVSDSAGKQTYLVSATVPLDIKGLVVSRRVPASPTAKIVVSTPDGRQVLTRTIAVGEQIALPEIGTSLRLDGVGYYARLSIVDDWSIPLLYAALAAAMVGLTTAAAVRQQIVLATIIEGPDGLKVAVKVRLWRNASSSRSEIEDELTRALGGADKGSTT
jgi:cytochrome c biogenesis protein ResB